MYPMKKIYFALAILSLALVRVDATEQDSVNRCAAIIREFRIMPERAIPRDVLRHARGLAIMIVLNNYAAVQAFSRGGNVTIGADVSAAAGPVGRTASGAITPTAAVYTYSKSKGLFAGVSLEGAVIGTQRESNFRYYGQPVRADGILSGEVPPPPGAAPLRRALSH